MIGWCGCILRSKQNCGGSIFIFFKLIVKNIEFEFGVGGDDKKNSSSWILKNWLGEAEDSGLKSQDPA